VADPTTYCVTDSYSTPPTPLLSQYDEGVQQAQDQMAYSTEPRAWTDADDAAVLAIIEPFKAAMREAPDHIQEVAWIMLEDGDLSPRHAPVVHEDR